MKSQLEVCAVERVNCCDTAMSSGTAPKTYHKKAVKPAHNAAELNSPSSGLQFTFRSYPNRYLRTGARPATHQPTSLKSAFALSNHKLISPPINVRQLL